MTKIGRVQFALIRISWIFLEQIGYIAKKISYNRLMNKISSYLKIRNYIYSQTNINDALTMC